MDKRNLPFCVCSTSCLSFEFVLFKFSVVQVMWNISLVCSQCKVLVLSTVQCFIMAHWFILWQYDWIDYKPSPIPESWLTQVRIPSAGGMWMSWLIMEKSFLTFTITPSLLLTSMGFTYAPAFTQTPNLPSLVPLFTPFVTWHCAYWNTTFRSLDCCFG